MRSRSTTRPWLLARRQGEDVLRLLDGSLRAVLECAAPGAGLNQAIAALCDLTHPVQVVTQSRRPAPTDGAGQLVRLRTSCRELVARLSHTPCPLMNRLLVVVSWDVEKGKTGEPVLRSRLRDVRGRLDHAGLEPAPLSAAGLQALMPDDEVAERRSEVLIGGRFTRTLVLSCHPARLDPAWFDSLETERDLAVHLRQVTRGRTAFSTYLTLWARSRPELDDATQRALETLFWRGVIGRRPYWQAETALIAGLPLGLDLLGPREAVLVKSTRPLLPRGPGGERATHELLFGVDPGSSRPLELDRFRQSNPNAVVLGRAASGGSFLVKLELLRARVAGLEAHLVDVTGEHGAVVSALGGSVVAPELGSRTPFDPFRVTAADTLSARVQMAAALIELLCGSLPPSAQAVVRDAIGFVYAAHGHVEEGDNGDRTPPGLGDILAALARRAGAARGSLKASLEQVGERLEGFLHGDGRRLFEAPAAMPAARAPITAYSLAGLPEEHRPAALLLSLDQIWGRLAGDRPALVIVDDVDPLLPFELSTRWLAGLLRSAAKRRAGLTLVSRDVASILDSPLRDGVLDAGMKALLGQVPRDASRLAEIFHLTPPEQSWLANAEVGEGLLLADGQRLPFKAVASDEERRLIDQGGSR